MASETEPQQQQQQQQHPTGNGSATSNINGDAPKQPTRIPMSEDTAPRAEDYATETRAPATAALFSDGSEDDNSTAGDSDRLLSPSVTSPPYWAHGNTRAASNLSVESVVSPHAITLQDNEHDDGPGGSNVYGRDRNRACWAKSVNVVDYVLVNGSTTNIGAFVVWNIKVETLNGSYMNIRKRYSEFDDLRKRLVQTFPNFEAAVPILPPKSVISKFRTKFLEKRRAGLQYFLNCIMLNPEFSGSPVLKEFLFS
ncbi:Phox homologous domain-containing protein [Podospora appendiculata]|uniref:Endosomal/vacuolar adapter protein YPT35 n=1 Tax=Podospora appendiculata TaxID=314037 RepID=A0AAE0XHI4_9PEZI|nr:Phox homologous domain-containing protein [Podospora appendiculata]